MKKRIINVDETWLSESNFVRKTWSSTQSTGNSPLNAVTPSLSMLTSLNSNGSIHFALSHANTDQDTFMLFMRHLVARLDHESPDWQESSIILIDCAKWHTGEEIRDYLHKM